VQSSFLSAKVAKAKHFEETNLFGFFFRYGVH